MNAISILSFSFIWNSIMLFGVKNEEKIPVNFSEYGVMIYNIPALGDTIYHNRSSKEKFKIVFFDYKGKCYCERYMNGVLFEKGTYENSLDTLKRYVSDRAGGGKTISIRVQKYFQPLKSGEWIIYSKGKKTKRELYDNGILIE